MPTSQPSTAQAEAHLLDAAGQEIERLQQCLASAESPTPPAQPRGLAGPQALLQIELEGLSSLRARLGEGPTQALLALLAARLGQGTRPGDQTRACEDAARLDCLLAGVHSGSQGLAIAERLLQRLGAPWQLGSLRGSLRVSIGLAHGGSTGLPGLRSAASAALQAARRRPGSVVLVEVS